MNNIAIIPARGGSKRIPRKNIYPIDGIPLIANTILMAINSCLFDQVIVTTDDLEIAEISRSYGASVPRLRDKKLSDDFATTYDVMADSIHESWIGNLTPDYVCCIYPASIFLTEIQLESSFKILVNSDCSYVFPVQQFSPPIQRGFQIAPTGEIEMVLPEHLLTRSQDLQPTYFDSGQFYWGKLESWRKKEPIFGKNSRALLCGPYDFVDIDNQEDLDFAIELLAVRKIRNTL